MMRRLDVMPLRMVAAEVVLPNGDVLTVLSCSHERKNVPDVKIAAGARWARCPYCIGGVEAVVPIEKVPTCD